MQKGYIILDVKCFFSKGIIVKKIEVLVFVCYYFSIILLLFYLKF